MLKAIPVFLIIFVSLGNALAQSFLHWAQQISSDNFDAGHSVAVDKHGNIYTTGMFQNIADFDKGSGIFNLSSNGAWDVFLLKSDSAGNFPLLSQQY